MNFDYHQKIGSDKKMLNENQLKKLKDELETLKTWLSYPKVKLEDFFDNLRNKATLAYLHTIQKKISLNNDPENKQRLESTYHEIIETINQLEGHSLEKVSLNKRLKSESAKTVDLIETNLKQIENNYSYDELKDLIDSELCTIQSFLFDYKTVIFYSSEKFLELNICNHLDTTATTGKLLIIKDVYLNKKSVEKLGKIDLYLESVLTNDDIKLIKIENLNFGSGHIDELEFKACQIFKLDLESRNLRTIHLNAFYGFTSLVRLNLAKNLLTDLDPRLFNYLHNLEFLDLSNNQFTFFDSTIFYCLMKLKELNLSHNKINQILPGTYFNLVNLERLDLSYNNLVSIKQDSFKGLENTVINLDYNWILGSVKFDQKLFSNLYSKCVIQ